MSITREKLYEEVWAEPMLKVAERYGVASTFLAQVCQRLSVPRPPRGYWNRVAVGQQVPRPPLAPARPGDQVEWLRNGEHWALPKPLERPVNPVAPQSAPATQRKKLRDHPLVAVVQPQFEVSYREDDGYLRPRKQLLPDIVVSRQSLPRALKLANDIFVALEERGCHVVIAPHGVRYVRPTLQYFETKKRDRYSYGDWSPGRPTIFHVGTVAFGITIYEVSDPSLIESKDGVWRRIGRAPESKAAGMRSWNDPIVHDWPAGRLGVRVYAPYEDVDWVRDWREAKRGDLRDRLSEVFTTIEGEVPTILKLIEEAQQRHELRARQLEAERREWERKMEEERRAKAFKDSKDELLSMIQAWSHARHLEEFFELANREVAKLEGDERIKLLEKLERARKVFGTPDPLERLRTWRLPEER